MHHDLKNKIEKIISSQSADEKEILFQLNQLICEYELRNSAAKDSRRIAELAAESIRQLQGKANQDNVIKTGLTEFDQRFGGFGLGELVVIGGRPAMGKTQLLVNLSLNISVSVPVLYFAFDLSEFFLTNRFISALSDIPVHKILQHDLTDEQKEKLASIETQFSKYKIFVNDSCDDSMTAFKAECQKQIQENGVKIIIVDYLQLMTTNKNRSNRDFEIGSISRELKNIAKDFNVCVIASSQLSRAVEVRGGSKRPILSDLRESGAIEQDADKVIFIYRPEYYRIYCDEEGNNTEGLMELIVAKNRNGMLGTITLMRDENFINFSDSDQIRNDFLFSQDRLNEISEIDDLEEPF
jgi:replicative DNA helicase